MQQEQAKNLFREKFENIISKESAAELLKYAETAIRNHRGEKFASEIQPPDFSLQDLVFMISDAKVTKDHTDIIFQAFINYSSNLRDFNTFLSLLVNEKKIELHRDGLVNLFLSAKYAYLARFSFIQCLYPKIEKILLLIIDNIADLPSDEVLLFRIHDHLIQLIQSYLVEFTSYQELPKFLKEEIKLINELLNKNNLSLEERNDILLGYVLMFVEDTLNREKEVLLNNGMVGENGIISIPVKYRVFCGETIESVLTFPLGSLTNSNFGFSQNHLLNQNLWGQWRAEAANASKEFLRNSVKKIIPESNKENWKISEKESKKEANMPQKDGGPQKGFLGKFRFSANLSSTRAQSSTEASPSRTQSSTDVLSPQSPFFSSPKRPRSKLVSQTDFEKVKENLPAYVIPPENKLDDTSAKEIIKAIEDCCAGLEKLASGKVTSDEATSAVKVLENRIQDVLKMRDYQQTLPALRKLCFKIKETFPTYKEKLADIDKECNKLLDAYKDLIKNDDKIRQEKGLDYATYVKGLPDKRLLEIACFLDTNLLLNTLGMEKRTGISGMLLFSARYSPFIEHALSLIYQGKELEDYQNKLKAITPGTATTTSDIYNNDDGKDTGKDNARRHYASHFENKEQDLPESDPGFGSIKPPGN